MATKTISERVAELADAESRLKHEWWGEMSPAERQESLKYALAMGEQETIESAWQHWKQKVLNMRPA